MTTLDLYFHSQQFFFEAVQSIEFKIHLMTIFLECLALLSDLCLS